MERRRVRANYNANLPAAPPLTSLIRRVDADSDAEISIFDAERYFSEEVDQVDVLKKKKKNYTTDLNGGVDRRDSSESSGDGSHGRNYFRTRSFRASTPTASSEASWNSQTGLLPAKPPGSASRKGATSSTSTSTSSFPGRRFFGRHCPCSGKRSVEVEDKFSETKSSIRSHDSSIGAGPQSFPIPDVEAMEMTKLRICATEPAADIGRRIVKSGAGSFSFPVLISPATVPPPLAKESEEPARVSLEVFRPSVELARILTESSSAPARDDDVASDTSSELFELESFSAHSSAAHHRRLRRDSLDELPKLAAVTATMQQQLSRSSEEPTAPSECYAPSEASVEWSVTTAEGGFERTASEDCGEVRSAQAEKEVRFGSAATRNEGGAGKKRGGDGGGLLNCGCEKAVSVGPDPVRFVPEQHCQL